MTAEPQHDTNPPPRREREPEKPRLNGAGHDEPPPEFDQRAPPSEVLVNGPEAPVNRSEDLLTRPLPLALRAPEGFRTQPHNVEAEQALLGAILINNAAWHEVATFLRPEHFYEPVHGRLFGAMDRTIRAGHLADHILLYREFNDDDALRELDGAQYLARLARAAETIVNAGEYGRLLHDLAIKRGLIHVGEELVNKAYDVTIVEPAGTQIGKARELFQHLSRELSPISPLPEVDLDIVAEGQFSAHEWAIDQIVPVGTAGLIGGPQSAGKTFLELIRMICMVTGRDFLGHKVRQIHAALGYFSEDSKGWLERYIGKICRALQIDPRDLKGRFRAISTFGAHRVLFRADRDATEVTPTAWFDEVRDDALSMRAGWVAFDHLLRYCAYPHISTPLNFSLFEQLDALSTEISGNVVVLTHPSKTDMRAGVKGLIQIGGAASLVQAPRWVQTLRRLDDEGGRKIRQFTVEKVSYGERQRFAIRLSENDGIVVHDGEMDPDDDGSGKNPSRHGARGPASNAGRTLMALEEMFAECRREITLDELVAECIRRGVINEAQENSNAWRDRRKLVRRHMSEKRELVDIRTSDLGECYALKPQL